MATFEGTITEFKRYIGPRLRNLVNLLTKRHKRTTGACEYCGGNGQLDAAHVHGRDRTQIIDGLLGQTDATALVSVNLAQFEAEFRREHAPIEKAILILCRQCHRTYDEKVQKQPSADAKHLPKLNTWGDILPFTFDPSPASEFKRVLLRNRTAEFAIFYSDGRVERREWKLSQFKESSDLMRNLRSRPEFRKGAWQAAGIVKVHVRVLSDH